MSDGTFVTLVWMVLALIVLAIFPLTRPLLTFALKQLWDLIKWVGTAGFNRLQAMSVDVWRAHKVIFINLMPRRAALPSVGEKGTRRD